MLKAAAMGIKRVYLHSTPNRLFAVFQPGWGFTNGTSIERPHIMPMYNGLLVVNEMIGNSGCSKIAEIENVDAGLSTYGVWEHNKLEKLVLINSNVYTEASAARSAFNVTLGGRDVGRQATVKRLSIPYTNSTSGMYVLPCFHSLIISETDILLAHGLVNLLKRKVEFHLDSSRRRLSTERPSLLPRQRSCWFNLNSR
jgi:hypothetical protein